MRLARVVHDDLTCLAADTGTAVVVMKDPPEDDLGKVIASGPDSLAEVAAEVIESGTEVDPDSLEFLPPLPAPRKIVCVGLNYRDHAAEAGFQTPEYPTLFARFDTTLIGHGQPILTSTLSDQLDYEGEIVAVIGSTVRNAVLASATDAVCAYTLFNDASVRDFQMKSPQWTAGKNFDGTGAFGPWLVTADELPPGVTGLSLETRLNGSVVQSASTDDMIFNVAELITTLSAFMTLLPGDVIVTGTPSGVGMSYDPPRWMCSGDVCEVEVEGIGVLRNPIL